MRKILFIVVILLGAACGSIFDANDSSPCQLIMEDFAVKIGEPDSITTQSDGLIIWHYGDQALVFFESVDKDDHPCCYIYLRGFPTP